MTGMKFYFGLYSNYLTGHMPSEFGSMSMTGGFYLQVNSLSGSIPSQLAAWTALRAGLYTSHNHLAGPAPSELGALTALTYGFYLNSNSLSGTIPSQFGCMTKMLGYLVHPSLRNSSFSQMCRKWVLPLLTLSLSPPVCRSFSLFPVYSLSLSPDDEREFSLRHHTF